MSQEKRMAGHVVEPDAEKRQQDEVRGEAMNPYLWGRCAGSGSKPEGGNLYGLGCQRKRLCTGKSTAKLEIIRTDVIKDGRDIQEGTTR